MTSGYEILHLYGYYDCGDKIGVIEQGFDDAISIIKALKPFSKNGVQIKYRDTTNRVPSYQLTFNCLLTERAILYKTVIIKAPRA